MSGNEEQVNGLHLYIEVAVDDEKIKQKKERITQLIQEVQHELDTFSDVIDVRS